MLDKPRGGGRIASLVGLVVTIGEPKLHLPEGRSYGDGCSVTGKTGHLDISIWGEGGGEDNKVKTCNYLCFDTYFHFHQNFS